ncbi:hypothetical protein MRX96_031065 [Rhipicephalus microplus]
MAGRRTTAQRCRSDAARVRGATDGNHARNMERRRYGFLESAVPFQATRSSERKLTGCPIKREGNARRSRDPQKLAEGPRVANTCRKGEEVVVRAPVPAFRTPSRTALRKAAAAGCPVLAGLRFRQSWPVVDAAAPLSTVFTIVHHCFFDIPPAAVQHGEVLASSPGEGGGLFCSRFTGVVLRLRRPRSLARVICLARATMHSCNLTRG